MMANEVVKAIIKEQSLIIGDNLARKMAIDSGVVYFNSPAITDITVNSEEDVAVEKLIASYEKLFGPASVEVCRDVVKRFSASNKTL
jgi:hypothetical protein